MAFIIDKKGNKVHVDLGLDTFSNNCVLYDDNAGFRDIYILNLYRGKFGSGYGEDDTPILVKQIEYKDNSPSKDEIMFRMWKEGLSRYDFVTIEKGYMLDWIGED